MIREKIMLISLIFLVLFIPFASADRLLKIGVVITDEDESFVNEGERFSLDLEKNKIAVFEDKEEYKDVIVDFFGIKETNDIPLAEVNFDLVENKKILDSKKTEMAEGDLCYFFRYQLRLVDFEDNVATFTIEKRSGIEYLIVDFLRKIILEPFTID